MIQTVITLKTTYNRKQGDTNTFNLIINVISIIVVNLLKNL